MRTLTLRQMPLQSFSSSLYPGHVGAKAGQCAFRYCWSIWLFFCPHLVALRGLHPNTSLLHGSPRCQHRCPVLDLFILLQQEQWCFICTFFTSSSATSFCVQVDCRKQMTPMADYIYCVIFTGHLHPQGTSMQGGWYGNSSGFFSLLRSTSTPVNNTNI